MKLSPRAIFENLNISQSRASAASEVSFPRHFKTSLTSSSASSTSTSSLSSLSLSLSQSQLLITCVAYFWASRDHICFYSSSVEQQLEHFEMSVSMKIISSAERALVTSSHGFEPTTEAANFLLVNCHSNLTAVLQLQPLSLFSPYHSVHFPTHSSVLSFPHWLPHDWSSCNQVGSTNDHTPNFCLSNPPKVKALSDR